MPSELILSQVVDGAVVFPCGCGGCVEVDLISTNSGITLCGCIVITGIGNYIVTATTGITGIHTVTLGGGFWSAIIGSFTAQQYLEDDCTTPIGDPFDTDVTEIVTCSNGIYTPSVSFIGPKNSFTVASGQPLDTTFINGLTCADSGFLLDQITLSI